MKHVLLCALGALLMSPLAVAQKSAHPFGQGGGLRGEPTPVPTRFVLGAPSSGAAHTLANAHGARIVDRIPGQGLYLLEPKLPSLADAANAKGLLTALANSPLSFFAEMESQADLPETTGCIVGPLGGAQDCVIPFVDGTPSTETFLQQPSYDLVGAAEAQQWSPAGSSVVAVIDTGVDLGHSLLAGQLHSVGYDFLRAAPGAADVADGADNDHDGYVDEALGHGTHVAGAVLLVHPEARILPLRVLDSDGNGRSFTLAKAIFHAVDAGADVINLSLSILDGSKAVAIAIEHAEAFDVLVVTSAGNTGANHVLFPGTYDPIAAPWHQPFVPSNLPRVPSAVLTVTAVDLDRTKAPFAAWGACVDIAAPGVDVYSSVMGEGFAWWSGTSMAAAVVSGAASLVHAIRPDVKGAALGQMLLDTAAPIDQLNVGYEQGLGAGLLDVADAAVEVQGP